MKRFIQSLLFLLLTTASQNVRACTCTDVSIYYNYNNSDIVFEGKILRIDQTSLRDPKTIYFLVSAIYKGSAATNDTLKIHSGPAGECGLEAQVGDSWIIFSENGRADMCSANILLERGGESIKKHPWELIEYSAATNFLAKIPKIKDGSITEYNKDGKLIASGKFHKGKPDGQWEYQFIVGESFRERLTVSYSNGTRYGEEEREVYIDGRLHSKSRYDKEQGGVVWDYYDENGKLIPADPKR